MLWPNAHRPVRYGGCLAPHSKLRGAIIPTPRQQGVQEPEGRTPLPHWNWARLLKRVFTIGMERCPVCQQGTLRLAMSSSPWDFESIPEEHPLAIRALA